MKKLIQGLIILIFISACAPDRQDVTSKAEAFVDSLLAEMTLEEKVGQMTLFTSSWDVTGPVLKDDYEDDIQSGLCGNIFNAHTVAFNRELQRIAVEKSRLGIPLLFGYDVIHGHKTIFPIPLAEACTWSPELIEKSARLSAEEAAASGLNWTFNPMVDLSVDPRWGRIAEGSGEDPYLSGLIAAAKVKGYQGESLDDPLTLAACVKHFAAYGAPQAGRDYHTVDMSELVLRQRYLPPYKAAIEAGAATVMTSFNELFGVPATGSKYLLEDILRDEWDFKGVVVTDYTSINEMIPHGYARDEKHAGELAVKAGVDMDMQGAVYYSHLKDLVEEGTVSVDLLDRSVRRVLRLKYDLGLFDDPYHYLDEAREQEILFSDRIMEHALVAARKSIVLLQNEPFNQSRLLPIKEVPGNIALIGPLGENRVDLLGTWHASGDESKVVTVREGLQKKFPGSSINYVKGVDFSDPDKTGFDDAIRAALEADLVILALGENYQQSGEAASRSDIRLPGVQEELLQEITETGKPVIGIIMAGRPLVLTDIRDDLPAILFAWHLGTRSGDAIADVITGDYNPSGKLPVTFPKNVGQIPIYYNEKNTGRPFNADNKYTSKYLDVSNEPLYPFGYGLSYTDFEYSSLNLDSETLTMDGTINVTVTVSNTGEHRGEETVQLYIRDLVASITRPVKELKGFKKVDLEPGTSEDVTFILTIEDLKFYNSALEYVAEPGLFKVFAGGSSTDVLEAEFELMQQQ